MSGKKLSELLNSRKNGDLSNILQRAESIRALTDVRDTALAHDARSRG